MPGGCGKIAYASAKEAWKAAQRVRGRRGPAVYAYRCRACKGAWHLASKVASRPEHMVRQWKRRRAELRDGDD
jgi:hypothetical protein